MWNQVKTMSFAGVAGVVAFGAFSAVQVGAQSTDPQQVYQLVSIDGQPLPVTVETEGDCREEVTDAALTLSDDGEWRLEIGEREVCGDAVEDEEVEEEAGTYTMAGETVRFSDDDDEDDTAQTAEDEADEDDEGEGDDDEEADEAEDNEVELEDLAVGTMSADGLTIQLEDGQTVLVFRS